MNALGHSGSTVLHSIVLLLCFALACGLCSTWGRPGRSGRAPAAADDTSERIDHLLSQLSSADEAVRSRAAEALVAIGPRALFQLCPYVREHLDDADERAWRAAYAIEEEIARRCADDPHLDDYYNGLKCVKLPRKVVTLPGGAEMEFVRVPAGTFIQGCRRPGVGMPMACEAGHSYSPVRKVTLTRPFWIMRDEVTQRQFRAVMGYNPSRLKQPHRPVESVTYFQALAFCRRLSAMCAPDEFGLPTEAQWEYACRAGTTGQHAYGNRPLTKGIVMLALDDRVGENLFGLLHMHDGVFEWCRDFFGRYSELAATDPTGPPEGLYRTVRSNYEFCSAPEINAAHRIGWPPEIVHAGIGLRLVCKARGTGSTNPRRK